MYSGYALLSESPGEKLLAQSRIASLLRWLMGSVFIALGARLLFPERS